MGGLLCILFLFAFAVMKYDLRQAKWIAILLLFCSNIILPPDYGVDRCEYCGKHAKEKEKGPHLRLHRGPAIRRGGAEEHRGLLRKRPEQRQDKGSGRGFIQLYGVCVPVLLGLELGRLRICRGLGLGLRLNVDKIVGVLENHQVVLMKDIAMFDQMYELNLKYYKELTMYIIAGKKKLAAAAGWCAEGSRCR